MYGEPLFKRDKVRGSEEDPGRSTGEQCGFGAWPTVRSWLVRDTGSSASETLEMSRLRRENRDLTELIGRLTVKSDRLEKNQRRGNH